MSSTSAPDQTPGPRRQSRGARTRGALLDAAEVLILEGGCEAATITAISARAGVSVGALYHHFTDREALLRAVFDRAIDAYAAASREAAAPGRWAGASVIDLLGGYIDFMLAMGARKAASPSVVPLVLAEHPEWRPRLTAMQAEGRRHVARLILHRRDQIEHADPDMAVPVFVDQLAAMLSARIDPAQSGAVIARVDDAVFKAELLTLGARYLDLSRTE
jgi:AcrR family transcriptional regulator